MSRSLIRFFSLLILVFLLACRQKDHKAQGHIAPEKLYLDYQVNAEEGDDNLTVLVRFSAGEEGKTLLLPAGTTILLDNVVLEADSSKRTGAFYEINLPIDAFRGKHTLVLKQGDTGLYTHSFDFFPIEIVEEPRDSITRADLVFTLKGLQPEDYIRVIATDTAFYSEGINRLDTVRKNQLVISGSDLSQLVSGPVQFVLSREWEEPLLQEGSEKGRFKMVYSLRREFVLKD